MLVPIIHYVDFGVVMFGAICYVQSFAHCVFFVVGFSMHCVFVFCGVGVIFSLPGVLSCYGWSIVFSGRCVQCLVYSCGMNVWYLVPCIH